MKRLVHTVQIDTPVQLIQNGRDSFTVRYGKQVRKRLSYGEAGLEFGLCVMHSAACAGRLDNRDRGER